MKRAILAGGAVLAALALTYAYSVTRRERLYQQLVVRGDYALARGDTYAAVSAFSDAIALKPDSMLGYLKRGDARRRRGELEAAAVDLSRATAIDRASPRALELLGDVDAARQQHGAAATHYRAALRLDDQSPRVLYKLALCQEIAGRHTQAAETLRQAVTLDPRFGPAHYLLGVCLRQMRQTSAAQASFERAVAVAPELLAAREELASLYAATGRRAERIRQLEALLEQDPAPARQIALALAYADANQTSRGVRILARLVESHPDSAPAYQALGELWLRLASDTNDRVAVAKASEALQHAASMDPVSPVLTRLGQARLAAADPTAAERTLRTATETMPVEPEAFLLLAEAASLNGHTQAARRALLDYQDLTGAADQRFLLRLAEAHWRSGDPASARRTLTQVLRKDADNAAALDLEHRIASGPPHLPSSARPSPD